MWGRWFRLYQRVKRRLASAPAILALVLCVAFLGLWSRELHHVDHVVVTKGGRLWWVTCGGGRMRVTAVRGWPCPERLRWVSDGESDQVPFLRLKGAPRDWQRLGVGGRYAAVETLLDDQGRPVSLAVGMWERDAGGPLRRSPPMASREVAVPLWTPAALCAVVALASFARRAARVRRRGRRADAGQCPSCGYDLRATPGRCRNAAGQAPSLPGHEAPPAQPRDGVVPAALRYRTRAMGAGALRRILRRVFLSPGVALAGVGGVGGGADA